MQHDPRTLQKLERAVVRATVVAPTAMRPQLKRTLRTYLTEDPTLVALTGELNRHVVGARARRGAR